MTAIRAILVDDEPLALKGLRLRLENIEDVEIVGECRNGREAVQKIRELEPDLVFLDIQMPGLDGFGVIRALVGTYMPRIVFVTAYDEYALKAFEAHALDYILKPPEEERLKEAVRRTREQLREQSAIVQTAEIIRLLEGMEDPPEILLSAVLSEDVRQEKSPFASRLHIKDRGHITRVETTDISYIEAAGDYMCIHTAEKTHILRATMKTMEKKLDPAVFQRAHRSTIVNLDRVRELRPHSNGEYFLVLDTGHELKLSRTYKSLVSRFQ